MKASRKSGVIVGTLFILGTVSGIFSFFLTGEMNGSQGYLDQIASDHIKFTAGAFMVLIMGFAVAFIPIVLYPVLSKHSKPLAIGYVVFRGAIETVTYFAVFVSMLMLLFAGKTYAGSVNPALGEAGNIAAIILQFRELSSASTIFAFGTSAVLLYIAFYRSKLVPDWLSVWGLIAIILYLVTGFLIIFMGEEEVSEITSYLSLPIFLQEMVMAVWLIVKGFRPGPFDKNETTQI